MKRKLLVTGAAVIAIAAGGAGAALAVGGGGGETGGGSVSGAAADRASAAALTITGGGTANAVERDNEQGATWEVEVTKPDGTTVDVRLGADYGLVVVDSDSESAADAGKADAGN